MQNLILFQTVTNSGGEFVSHLQKKLKSKQDFIFENEFSFHKIKIFIMKSPSWK